MTLKLKTKPYEHQRDEYEAHREAAARALFWEMGCGKTKTLIDCGAWLYLAGEVNGWLVLAPNGVHSNWVHEELPAHLPEDVDVRTLRWAYVTASAGTKKHQKVLQQLLQWDGLSVIAMSYDAFVTKRGREFAKEFLTKRRCYYVLDESRRIKSPGSKRTRTVLASAKYAPYRRIATGTPVANGPFDIYAPMKFLDEGFWKRCGWSTFTAFKAHFGVWEQRQLSDGRQFQQLLAFQRLDRLQKLLEPLSSRVLKEEVLDLPPKVYKRRRFGLPPAHRRIYEELRDEYITFLGNGELVAENLAITRELRLRQILSGYVPTSTNGQLAQVGDRNPRLEAFRDLVDDVSGSAIVWACFRQDLDQLCELLGSECVRYDGSVGAEDRAAALRRFQAGEVKWFVGNPQTCGTGLTLHRASTVVYYNNSADLELRLQSEDRAHRIGQTKSVTYVDLVCEGTVDEKMVMLLRKKERISAQVLGDALRSEV